MRLCLYYSGLLSCRHKKLSSVVWTATAQNWNKSIRHIEQRARVVGQLRGLGELNSSPHFLNIYFRLSGFQFLPLLIQFQYGMNACSHCYTKVWHRAFLICDALLSRLAQHSFTPVQKSPPNHLSYVWTEALTGMVFMPVQELSSIVLTLSLML